MLKKTRPEERFYRNRGNDSFEIVAGESDIFIRLSNQNLKGLSLRDFKKNLTDYLINLRTQIEVFAKSHRDFLFSLKSISYGEAMIPNIVSDMISASKRANVGPMAGVAGSINKFLGYRLKTLGIDEFTLENGGDVLVSSRAKKAVGIYSGIDMVDKGLAILLPPGTWGVCSSSSKIGHSLSFGNMQLVIVVSRDVTYADCLATYLANSRTLKDFLERCSKPKDVLGIMGVHNDKVVLKGQLNLVKLGGIK